MLYEGKIESLNSLPYVIDVNNNSWIQEKDIIDYLCNGNGTFYMQYFIGETYLNLQNNNGKFPLLNVLIAAHQVFEVVSDLANKLDEERNYERRIYPFIFQLAKIGASEIGGDRKPLEIMEEMLLKNIK